MNTDAVVFNIQRFSLHDGPGIRTTVFLKGCTMRCAWCHNPEGQHPDPEIRYFPDRCIACGQCVTACPNKAHELHDGLHIFLRERCETIGKCVETCYSRALQLEGQRMTVADVMDEVLRDTAFYESSGGGVTLSGGDPVVSADFARDLLEECKRHRLHTALETCGECPWAALEMLLPVTDLIMMDLKEMAAEKHQSATGQSNERILSNARRLALTDKRIIFRTPVVPTVNDTEKDIGQIARFVRELTELRTSNGKSTGDTAAITYELMAFHKLASDKYRSLDLEYTVADIDPPTKAKMSVLLDVATRCGVQTSIR